MDVSLAHCALLFLVECASNSSRAFWHLPLPRVAVSEGRGSHPHLLQCSGKWAPSFLFKFCACSLSRSFAHLPVCPT
uniref:Putative secreted protein n=1 Tax=Ixodes ricinus TaxID=34613 RepID=A0A6B0U4H2_IXORI